jgi:DNA-binding HxlR family transcriptional regulator
MNDFEFDLLDELYFVQHYNDLKRALGWEDELIINTLQALFDKELIKCYISHDQEVFHDQRITEKGNTYYYLASKKGLMLHNSI